MDPESIDVAPSADNGNIPVDAPSEQPETVVPTVETTPTEQPVETPVAELYELPDGRKVDAETLSKEWKENFYPDYTRKSQALAAKEKEPLPSNEPKENPYANPEYVPQSYEEILQVAEERALAKLDAREQERVEKQQAIENSVVTQLNEIKAVDSTLNENALFLHATKYGFRDLKLAHQNMKDMSEMVKKVQTTTATNIAKRVDPVSVSPGATGAKPDPSQFSSAVEYLRALKGTG